MLEIVIDMPALHRYAHHVGILNSGAGDYGYILHAWLHHALGPLAPRPWRLDLKQTSRPRVLGYTLHDFPEVKQYLCDFASPMVHAVAGGIAGKTVHPFSGGRRLGFEVLCCPVVRQARTGIEKDVFLVQDEGRESQLDRASIYSEWVKKQIELRAGAQVAFIQLAGFSLLEHVRKGPKVTRPRTWTKIVRPSALMQGELIVKDQNAFMQAVATGIGRHKAFGYGMLLLRPPS